MNKYTLLTLALLIVLGACSSSKKVNKKNKEKQENTTTLNQDTIKPRPIVDLEKEQEEIKANHVRMVQEQTDSYPDSLIIEWERGGCYGRCPIYKVRIYESGYAEYESKKFTEYTDDTTYPIKFSELEIEEIFARARKINFSSFDIFYDTNVSDLPSYYVYLKIDGNRKGIRDRRSGPEELKQFVVGLDEMLKTKEINSSK